MDFNYYYHRQQVSQMRADTAACDAARLSHQWLADAYMRLISHARTQRAKPVAA
nr:hypothetical protein [uncultured Sphingosinicella sp.]